MKLNLLLQKFGKVFEWVGIGIGLLLLILIISSLVLMAIDPILPGGWKLDAQIFVVLVSIVLSVAWSFLPKLRVKFAELAANIKAIVNVILMFILAVLMFLFTCTNWNPIPGVVCSIEGAKALATLIFLAVISNYTTYGLTDPPADVKEAKASRASG
ncbi:MAG TPA: hypothetical protein DIW44_12470 [Anaerolineaceae bacterium]|nr:hypothetical protein [Anaerolineaceae bacterium]